MIWTWLRDREPQGFFKDERSLLISYDMIPLRGLDKTRGILNRDGQIISGRLLECQEGPYFVPFRNNSPHLEAIDWGCYGREHDFALRCLCFYVYSRLAAYSLGLSTEDNSLLYAFHWRALATDKRRRKPLTKLKPQVEAILQRIGFEIRPVKFERQPTLGFDEEA